MSEESYRGVKMALEYAWTIINYLGDASPMVTPKERDAHLRAVIREAVRAYYAMESDRRRELVFPLQKIVSDPLPRPPQRWKGERF